jgi:hypothetical protein
LDYIDAYLLWPSPELVRMRPICAFVRIDLRLLGDLRPVSAETLVGALGRVGVLNEVW